MGVEAEKLLVVITSWLSLKLGKAIYKGRETGTGEGGRRGREERGPRRRKGQRGGVKDFFISQLTFFCIF